MTRIQGTGGLDNIRRSRGDVPGPTPPKPKTTGSGSLLDGLDVRSNWGAYGKQDFGGRAKSGAVGASSKTTPPAIGPIAGGRGGGGGTGGHHLEGDGALDGGRSGGGGVGPGPRPPGDGPGGPANQIIAAGRGGGGGTGGHHPEPDDGNGEPGSGPIGGVRRDGAAPQQFAGGRGKGGGGVGGLTEPPPDNSMA